MPKDINKATLMGHAGRDPELHVSGTGTVVSFSLATNERVQDNHGTWQEITEWHELVASGRHGEIVREYLRKGSWAYIEGRIQTRYWTDKDTGEQRFRKEIVVLDLNLLSYPSDIDRANGAQHRNQAMGPVQYVRYADEKISGEEVPY